MSFALLLKTFQILILYRYFFLWTYHWPLWKWFKTVLILIIFVFSLISATQKSEKWNKLLLFSKNQKKLKQKNSKTQRSTFSPQNKFWMNIENKQTNKNKKSTRSKTVKPTKPLEQRTATLILSFEIKFPFLWLQITRSGRWFWKFNTRCFFVRT